MYAGPDGKGRGNQLRVEIAFLNQERRVLNGGYRFGPHREELQNEGDGKKAVWGKHHIKKKTKA